LSLFHDNYL